jgi:hypothetical protein
MLHYLLGTWPDDVLRCLHVFEVRRVAHCSRSLLRAARAQVAGAADEEGGCAAAVRKARCQHLLRRDLAEVGNLRRRLVRAIALCLERRLGRLLERSLRLWPRGRATRRPFFTSVLGFADDLLEEGGARLAELVDYAECLSSLCPQGPLRRGETLGELFCAKHVDVPRELSADQPRWFIDADRATFWHFFEKRYGSSPRCLRFGSWNFGKSEFSEGRVVIWLSARAGRSRGHPGARPRGH